MRTLERPLRIRFEMNDLDVIVLGEKKDILVTLWLKTLWQIKSCWRSNIPNPMNKKLYKYFHFKKPSLEAKYRQKN